jgi:hypothetical protein
MLCGSCADQLRRQIPQDSHAAFVRGIVFGLGGFVLGLALYAAFVILTDIQWALVSLAAGWLVGKAIMLGSGGVGGRRYQIAAALLTYAAVSMAFIPILIHYQGTDKAVSQPAKHAQSNSGDSPAGQSPGKEDPVPASGKESPSLARFIGWVVLIGLASPFLQLRAGVSGVINLIILFVGMQFAWRMTRGVQIAIDGPYETPPGRA